MLEGTWRNDDLHPFPRWASALSNPHHVCILANLLYSYRTLSAVNLCWNHSCSQLETHIPLRKRNQDQEIPPKQWEAPSFPLSFPSAKSLSTRRTSRHCYPSEFLVLKLLATHPTLRIYRRKQVNDSWRACVNAPQKCTSLSLTSLFRRTLKSLFQRTLKSLFQIRLQSLFQNTLTRLDSCITRFVFHF